MTEPTQTPQDQFQAVSAQAPTIDRAIAEALKTADIPSDLGIVTLAAPEDPPIKLVVLDERPKAAFAIGSDEAAVTRNSEIAMQREQQLQARRIEEARVPGSNILRQHTGDLKPAADESKEQFDARRQEHLEAQKQAFTDLIRKARQPDRVVEYKAPPISERVAEQTKAELAAGRAASAKIAAQHANRPKPATPTGMTPVLRPASFVPDVRKGEGLTASNSARIVG